MLKPMSRRSYIGLMCSIFVLFGCASPHTQDEATASIREAQETLANFMKDPEMKWLHENMKNAKAIMISPQVIKAGFGIGGSGGRGVVIARSEDGRSWNGPAFYNLAAASIGFQAGAQTSEVVALVMSERAKNSLLSNSFKLGGDFSVAAGPVGGGASAPVTADMVAFTKSKGLYGGVNLDGSVVTVDDKANAAFYGKPATPTDILVKGSVRNPSAAPLLSAASAAR